MHGPITSAPSTMLRRFPTRSVRRAELERADELGQPDDEHAATDAGGGEAEGILEPHPLDHHHQLDGPHEQGHRGESQPRADRAAATTPRWAGRGVAPRRPGGR